MNILDSIREHLAAFSLLDSIKSVELSRKKIMKWAAYTIYGVLAFSLFFTAKYYVLRTDELVREAVGNLDSVSLEFSYLEPRLFPPRVLLEYLRIYEKKTQKPILLLKETEINLSVLPLLVGKVRLSVISRMYGGMMEADVSTGSLFNTEWVNVDLFLDMIELEKVPQVKEYDRTFKGFATVNASLRGEWASPLGMEGTVVASLAQLDMENRFPIVKGARLKGFNVDLDCAAQSGVLVISRFDLSSSDGISMKTEGTLTPNQKDFNLSVLDMRGEFIGPPARLAMSVLDPKAAAMLKKKQVVPVALLGEFKNPRITLK